MPRTFKLTLAYDGTQYAGWQMQLGQPTLQGELEAALADLTGSLVRVVGSGRTDSGVHALGQVVSFCAETVLTPDALLRAINFRLPDDMAVLAVEEAAPGFHAIHDAVAKRYRYVLHDGPVRDVFGQRYAWHLRTRVDAGLMHEAAQRWLGRHDFKSFQSQGSRRITTERTVLDISVVRGRHGDSNAIVLEVEADGFLYNMVRAMVGTLVYIGRRKQPIDWAGDVVAARNRKLAGMTAPAHGLFLLRVRYASGGASETTGLNLPHATG